MEAFAELMMMGVRVREVRDLDERSIWIPRRSLLFIDDDLGADECAHLAARLLPEAARRGLATVNEGTNR